MLSLRWLIIFLLLGGLLQGCEGLEEQTGEEEDETEEPLVQTVAAVSELDASSVALERPPVEATKALTLDEALQAIEEELYNNDWQTDSSGDIELSPVDRCLTQGLLDFSSTTFHAASNSLITTFDFPVEDCLNDQMALEELDVDEVLTSQWTTYWVRTCQSGPFSTNEVEDLGFVDGQVMPYIESYFAFCSAGDDGFRVEGESWKSMSTLTGTVRAPDTGEMTTVTSVSTSYRGAADGSPCFIRDDSYEQECIRIYRIESNTTSASWERFIYPAGTLKEFSSRHPYKVAEGTVGVEVGNWSGTIEFVGKENWYSPNEAPIVNIANNLGESMPQGYFTPDGVSRTLQGGSPKGCH